jgi:DNA-binding response OmpR family regulator
MDLHSVIKLMVVEHMALDNAPTLAKARVMLAQHAYDAVLLDIGLPDGNGLDLIPEIKEAQPKAAIFVLTGEEVSDKKINKIQGVLMKSRITPERLIEMITKRIHQNAHNND